MITVKLSIAAHWHFPKVSAFSSVAAREAPSFVGHFPAQQGGSLRPGRPPRELAPPTTMAVPSDVTGTHSGPRQLCLGDVVSLYAEDVDTHGFLSTLG